MVCKEATVATTEFLSRQWWQEKSVQSVESRNGPPDPETCLLAQIVKLAHHCFYWGYVSQRRLGLMEFFFFFTNIKWRFPLAMSLPLRSPLKRNHSLWLIICFSSIPLSSLLLWESWYFFVTFQANDLQINTCSCALKSKISPPVDHFFLDSLLSPWTHSGSGTELTSHLHNPLPLPICSLSTVFSSFLLHLLLSTLLGSNMPLGQIPLAASPHSRNLFCSYEMGRRFNPKQKGPKVECSMGLLEKVWLPDRKITVERNCSFSDILPGIVLKSWEDSASRSLYLIKMLP